MNRQDELTAVCKARGLPKIAVGTLCEVDGRSGCIVGANCSQNLNVVFDGDDHVSNCHPHFKMRIFNGLGGDGVCFESEDIYT